MDADSPRTPGPLQEGETAHLGFFCTMTAEINKLSHVGVDEFGRWARVRVEDHPEVLVKIEPDNDGYEELQLERRPPPKHKATQANALVDTGAQMVVMGIRTVYGMGLGKKHIMPVGMTIKAANTGGLKLLGGVLVKISGQSHGGTERVTRQLAYVAEEVDRVFLSKKASEELGIISKTFPIIGAYALKTGDNHEDDVTLAKDAQCEIKDFNPCDGQEHGKCSCPKRKLPPVAPRLVHFHLQ